MIFFGKGMISLIPATVYDIFYRSDNNMWAQKVIDFVTLTWISRRTYKKRLILWHFYIHLYKYRYICYTNFGSAWFYGGGSPTQPVYAGIWFREALRMTCECVIALVTCVATIITTVIAILSYLKDKKE